MHFCYQLLTYFFYPFSYFFLIIRKLKKKEHNSRYKEKLSQINVLRGDGFLVWFHVASVGEGMSILPLLESLEKEEKIKNILITSVTLSSANLLQKKLIGSKKAIHQFLPLDVPNYVNKFLKHWSPNLAIFIDSEVWPNFIFKIKKMNIPLLLINGRITKKTFNRWCILKKYAQKIFEKFDLCLAANLESENYLKVLGSKNVKNLGNLKFSSLKFETQSKLDHNILNKIKNRKIWVAASTHNTEEIFCAKTHLRLKKNHSNILTIIIPRHINRIKKINDNLSSLNLKTSLYSNPNQLNSNTDILLVDAYGENTKFFKITNHVFLGGSLIMHGGQNPIEATRLGCKIYHGPNVSNFKEIYEFLNNLKVSNSIDSVEQLTNFLSVKLDQNKDIKDQTVNKVEKHGQHILNNVIHELNKYI